MKLKFFDTAIIFLIAIFTSISVFVEINYEIEKTAENNVYSDINEVPQSYTGIILGAGVYPDGTLSLMLQDRVDTAIELYNSEKIKRILVSGDHGQVEYDEVNAIKNYLLKNGIPKEDIFLDHAGFDTYDSIYRAKEIFEVEEAIIITNEFHLPRALYIAESKDLKYHGIIADKRSYQGIRYSEMREKLANIKGFFDVKLNASPTFLGEKIPITGENHKSWD